MPRKKHIEPPESTATEEPASLASSVIFTVPEVARRWKVHRHTVTSAINTGRLQAFKVGERQFRIREAEVVRYENEHMGARRAS